MRNFFVKIIKSMSWVYMCFFVLLSYRLTYNEFYSQIHEEVETSKENEGLVYPVGQIVGIYTECKGVFVIDTCEIETEEGAFINPSKGFLQTGDYILAVNGIELEEKEDLTEAIESSNGERMELLVARGNNSFTQWVTPVRSKSGKYMLGLWIKDDLAGVGTICYVEEDGDFAALGHGMGDGETKELLSVKGGDIYLSKLIGIEKGEKGNPGEVKGVIYYGNANHIGEMDINSGEGIYGTLDEDDFERFKKKINACEIGNRQEIEVGAAQIISDVSGKREVYDIEIKYVDYLASNSNKGLHIEVTDVELLELTGGIVQGMSGSPIIQNGKLIGAVTHVLINDPAKGYGIFIDEMIPKGK